ncbi:MAG: Dabb family protein [Pseudomonadota bacterium]
MLRHIVLLQVSEKVTQAAFIEIFDELAAVALSVPGTLAFTGGPKISDSGGLHQGFTHGYTIDFTDKEARDAFQAGLDHNGVGKRLPQMTVGGLGGILVMNIDISNIKTPGEKPAKKLQAKWV